MSNNDLTPEEKNKRKSDAFFAQLKGKEFWIWDPHVHLLAFLKTRGRCCFNHCIGEPTKWGRPQPFF